MASTMAAPQELNPYAPPRASIDPPVAGDPHADLASLGARLGGSMIDGLLLVLTTIPAWLGMRSVDFAAVSEGTPDPFILYRITGTYGMVAAALMISVIVVQSLLIARRGQTLGKLAAKTRIVLVDGSPAPFAQAVLLRYWGTILVGYIPLAGQWLVLVDALFIFRGDRRCIYDLVAGTRVIKAV